MRRASLCQSSARTARLPLPLATAALGGWQGMMPCASSMTCSARVSPEHPHVVIMFCSGDLEPHPAPPPNPCPLIAKLAEISAQGIFFSRGLIGRVMRRTFLVNINLYKVNTLVHQSCWASRKRALLEKLG